jgi:hypothetical protein
LDLTCKSVMVNAYSHSKPSGRVNKATVRVAIYSGAHEKSRYQEIYGSNAALTKIGFISTTLYASLVPAATGRSFFRLESHEAVLTVTIHLSLEATDTCMHRCLSQVADLSPVTVMDLVQVR